MTNVNSGAEQGSIPTGSSPIVSPRGGGGRSKDYPAANDKTVKDLLISVRRQQSELDKLKFILHRQREEAQQQVAERLDGAKKFAESHGLEWDKCWSIWSGKSSAGK